MSEKDTSERPVSLETVLKIQKRCKRLFRAHEVADEYRREHGIPIAPEVPRAPSSTEHSGSEPKPD